MAEVSRDAPYPLPGHMTTKQYAKHRRITESRLSQLVSSGRLDGCYIRQANKINFDPVRCDAILDKTKHFREIQDKRKAEQREAEGLPPEEDGDDSLSDLEIELDPATIKSFKEKRGSKSVQQFSESQIEAAHYKAKLAKLKFEELEGTMISAEEVKAKTYEMARAMRDSLMELPDRLSAEFSAIRDERKIAIRLDFELRTALERVIKILEDKKEIPL